MPGRNQPRSSRGRSAIARRVINTNSTNGLGIHEGGGMKKAGAHPSATGFMRSKPWQISVPARKQLRFKRNIPNHTNHDTTDCDACTFDNNPGCYIKDISNISTNYCCIHHDVSGCFDASITSVCHDKKSANKGDETCLTGRDFPDCSGVTPHPPVVSVLPNKVLVGYIGVSTYGGDPFSQKTFQNNVIAGAKEAINQGVNILVLCFFSPDASGNLQTTKNNSLVPPEGRDGSDGAPGRNTYMNIIKELQHLRPPKGTPPKFKQALLFISFGGATPPNTEPEYLKNIGNIHDHIINNFEIDGIDFDYEQGYDTTDNYSNCLEIAGLVKKSSGILSSAAPEGVMFTRPECQGTCGLWKALLNPKLQELDLVWPQIYDGKNGCWSLQGTAGTQWMSTGSIEQIQAQNDNMISGNGYLQNRLVMGLPIGQWWKSGSCPDMRLLSKWPSDNTYNYMPQTEYITNIASILSSRGIMFWNIEWALGKWVNPKDINNTATGQLKDSGFIKYCAEQLGITIYTIKISVIKDDYGANKYSIGGVQQKTVELQINKTYSFEHISEHPVRFSTTQDGTHNYGSIYTDNVNNNSTSTTIEITDTTPKILYYFCAWHSEMGGMITIT